MDANGRKYYRSCTNRDQEKTHNDSQRLHDYNIEFNTGMMIIRKNDVVFIPCFHSIQLHECMSNGAIGSGCSG